MFSATWLIHCALQRGFFISDATWIPDGIKKPSFFDDLTRPEHKKATERNVIHGWTCFQISISSQILLWKFSELSYLGCAKRVSYQTFLKKTIIIVGWGGEPQHLLLLLLQPNYHMGFWVFEEREVAFHFCIPRDLHLCQ